MNNCCCTYGAAVAGEYPEFDCPDCERHMNGLGSASDEDRCKRHRRERASADRGTGTTQL